MFLWLGVVNQDDTLLSLTNDVSAISAPLVCANAFRCELGLSLQHKPVMSCVVVLTALEQFVRLVPFDRDRFRMAERHNHPNMKAREVIPGRLIVSHFLIASIAGDKIIQNMNAIPIKPKNPARRRLPAFAHAISIANVDILEAIEARIATSVVKNRRTCMVVCLSLAISMLRFLPDVR